LLATLNGNRGVRRAESGNDLRILLRNGTAFDISLASATTIGDVITAINTAGAGKITASAGTGGNLLLKDLTSGSKSFSASSVNGSNALPDLGLNVAADGGVITGRRVLARSTATAGLGAVLERHISRLIDPADGVITRQNKALDTRTLEFKNRMDTMEKLLTAKRGRLERQFANLESVLSGLQSQQQAIGQIAPIRLPTRSN
ncbi:MAG: flagellar filament capping protein FliD, partial [Tepidisphaeraceae bacterium]